jgi:type IV pilus assembly protein PilM
MAKRVIGLDIGSKYIKMALIKKGKKHTVLKTIYVSTPSDSVMDGEIKQVDTVAARIRSVLFEQKFKPNELYISINTHNVVAREIKLPILKEKEIDPAIEFELMQSFPGIIQSHTISSRIYSDPGMPVEGITVFCPNKILNDYVDIAKALVIPLKGIDINANALTKAAYNYMPKELQNETMLIVDIGHAMSQVNLITAGRLIISRQISTGIVKFDNLVANRIGISLDQAERARQNNKYDIYNLDKEDIDGFIRIAFAAVEDQIRSIIDYYRYNKSDENKISGIILFTGRGLSTGLSEYFGESFNLPVHMLTMPVKESTDQVSDNMAFAAVGCTMEPHDGKKDINLLPRLREIKAAGLRRIKLTRILAVILTVGAVALGAYTFLEFLIESNFNETMATQQEIITYSEIENTKSKLQDTQNRLANVEAALSNYTNQVALNTELLDVISKSMPETIFTVSYNASDNRITMSGISLDRPDLADFIYTLKESEKIESVTLSGISVRADAEGNPIDYSFSIEIKLAKAGAENEN